MYTEMTHAQHLPALCNALMSVEFRRPRHVATSVGVLTTGPSASLTVCVGGGGGVQGASVDDILSLAYPTLLTLHDPSRGVEGTTFFFPTAHLVLSTPASFAEATMNGCVTWGGLTCTRLPRVQYAGKDSMRHGILQSTLRIAFHRILPRCGSQDICC